MGSSVLDGPIDELILRAIGGDETVCQSLLNAEEKLASSITNPDHFDLLKVLYKFQKKFGRLPNWSDIDDYAGGMPRNAGLIADLDRLREAKDAYEPLFNSLDVLIDEVCQHAERETLNQQLDIAKRIAGTGWEDPKTKRLWQGNDAARDWLAAHVKPTERAIEEIEQPAEATGLKYPELAFPYEALPQGSYLKVLVGKASEGGLAPGLTCPAIMALVSVIPETDRMIGADIKQYVCLLALVGAGKDMAINRAVATLGLEKEVGRLWSPYAPSGERSLSTLIGDQPGPVKGGPRMPGPKKHCLVTYELEETLQKSRGETSAVLTNLQWFWDHNYKVFNDSFRGRKQPQTVDCRVSWLCNLPIGQDSINTDTFRLAFGEGTSHGLTDRMLWGFSEKHFDNRVTAEWEVPYEFNHFVTETACDLGMSAEKIPSSIERTETLASRFAKARVLGWGAGVKEQFFAWPDGKGRDNYHIHKVAVLVALINGHQYVEQSDWEFAVAFMLWQQRIRTVFQSGTGKRVSQGEFNGVYIKALERETARATKARPNGMKDPNARFEQVGSRECVFIRVKRMASEGRWYDYGLDVDKTGDLLVKSGDAAFMDAGEDERGNRKLNKDWVRRCGWRAE